MTPQLELPLFPLGTVLFKNGRLPLHIFEPRYVTMVENAIQTDTGFGVVLLRNGGEVHVGEATGVPEIYRVGTLASICEHTRLSDGRYKILVEGGAKISIENTWELADHLYMSHVSVEMDEPKDSIRESDMRLVEVLKQVTEAMRSRGYSINVDFEDASSVSMRLAEHLMMDMHYRQRLLEVGSAYRRLDLIWDWLHENSERDG